MRLRNITKHARVNRSAQLACDLGSYRYEALSSPTCIRLLELLPCAHGRRMRCSLKTFELQHAPPFKALSYTWGPAHTVIAKPRTHKGGKARSNLAEEATTARRHPIICDGQLLKVTGTLRDALAMLANAINLPHMPKIPSYYWVDSLCVDQQNIEERNTQVAQMAHVFRKAEGVVVWLGKEDEYIKDAITTMQRISTISETDWPLVPYTSFYNPKESHLIRSTNLTYYHWLGFIVLINRPWFKRAWVVQEIALGKSAMVVCGSLVFPWDMLSKTLSFVKATRWYHHLHTEKLRHLRELRKHSGIYKQVLRSQLSVNISSLFLNETRLTISTLDDEKNTSPVQQPPFANLLSKHRSTESTDPRDKVYAFLGLANRTMAPFRMLPKALVPNYNLSVQEVFTEAATVLMFSYKNLSWLSHVEDSSQRKIRGLPSWVPDLSVPLHPYSLSYRGPGRWRAASHCAWRPDLASMERGLLQVVGYHLDCIDQTSILLNESADTSATWASIVKLALALDLPYPDPGRSGKKPSRVEVLWRTLTTDIYNHTYPAPPETGSLFLEYILNLQIRHRLTPWSSADEFQPHHSPLSDLVYPEWRKLLELEPPDSSYCLDRYIKRLAIVVESMFNGTYSPIGLAQLQHELDQSTGKQRRIFKTSRGFMGTGARSLRAGDEVWVLHRGSLPFVLRPLPNGRYRLIGESFVYGVMHGEVLQMGLQREHLIIQNPFRNMDHYTPTPIPDSPATLAEKQIDAARRQTRLDYHLPTSPPSFKSWYRNRIIIPHISNQVEDLYNDCEQTLAQRQHFANALTAATSATTATSTLPPYTDPAMLVNPPPSDLETLYTRTILLYDVRLRYIQAEGARRMSTWADWWHETSKPAPHCNAAVANACTRTIAFLEDDYLKRKVEFVIEVYAVLERGDTAMAEAVLEDLGKLFPWLKDTGFLTRVREGSGDAFVGLRGKLPQV
ncbi:HET domain containing protein [Pyrenophora teres f. maculata]|nr:HET domain containing protein [Pyrenophora teres f. maculata]